MQHTSQCEIGIIGGGLIGMCAALALQHVKRTVTILEASSLDQADQSDLQTRSIALSYASVQIFKALDIWQSIKSQTTAIQNIHISNQGYWGISRLRASDYGIPALGYVIENHHLITCLLKKIKANDSIQLMTGASFESINNGHKVNVRYRYKNQSQQLNCQLALITDGTHSQARNALNIRHKTIDYGQSAIITNIEFDQPATNYAYERFTRQGPLALLPLRDNRYACVWTRNRQLATSLTKTDTAMFIEALQDCFGYRLGFINQVGKRFCIPLYRTQALELCKGRCILLGNAANTLHPVAAQGFNLALRDVAGLYELLKTTNNENLLIDTFQRSRQVEQRQVAHLSDSLVSLFSNQLPLLGYACAGNLAVLDQLPILKTQVAMSGMGFSFGGNALLRGHL